MDKVGPGRPRDPDYDRRILEAAVNVFAVRGWEGFTFEAVANAAGVGKPALYRRWRSRTDLLLAASTQLVSQEPEDHGSLAADVEAYVRRFFDFMMTDSGRAWVRLQVETPFYVELSTIPKRDLLGPAFETFEGITRRAMERGELHEAPPVSFLLEVVGGPIVMRTLHTPLNQGEALARIEGSYVRRLTDWILAGMRAGDLSARL